MLTSPARRLYKSSVIRLLLVSDTHIGLDLPVRPRVERRPRGADFLENYHRAMQPALAGEVDVVVHGGDLFHKPRVPAAVVDKALEPLHAAAEAGAHVVVVPGNHERGRLPPHLILAHPRIHVFHEPATVTVTIAGLRLALAGFPYQRGDLRGRFRAVVESTGFRDAAADINLLCVHHCIEGATVGAHDYVFRTARDVIRGADLDPAFAAVLSGHIHRHQVLQRDLRGRPLPAPVIYCGSVERTSIAERKETKGFVTMELDAGAPGGRLCSWRFHPLPTRPVPPGRPTYAGRAGRGRRRSTDSGPASAAAAPHRGADSAARATRPAGGRRD